MSIWVYVAGEILSAGTHITKFAYVAGFVAGQWLGITIQEKIAKGNISVMTIIEEKDPNSLVNRLRENGVPVTVMQSAGMNGGKIVLLSIIDIRRKSEVLNLIKTIEPKAVVTTSETNPYNRAYGII